MPPIHWDTIITGLVSAGVLWLVQRTYKAFADYQAESKTWRTGMDAKVDAIGDATQANMRAQLVHLYEKYVTRGWLTPEERAAWFDMHSKYSALNANGLIDSYHQKLATLPDKEI